VTPQEKERLRIWGKGLSGDIEIRFLATQDTRSQALSKFCADLARFASKVRVLREEGEPHEMPAVWIGSGLRYHGVPLGTELGPFLEALSDSDQGAACIPRSVRDGLAHIKVPAELRLYVSQQCHFCPVTARQVIPLARMNELIRVTIVDCVLFPEMARSHSIRSVPTLLLDERFRWTGALQLEELVAVMANRNPAKLSAASLEGLLKDGRASEVAEMMLAQESIFPAFIDLLSHEMLFIRLGAMVIMEEISGRNPELAAQVIDPLWERFPPAKDQVKGDIIYVLGESGNHEVVLRLEMILAGSYNSEVKEAAKEALEKIHRRATPHDICGEPKR
jgi:hypothetical protein